jgi:SulP family sulfate permease
VTPRRSGPGTAIDPTRVRLDLVAGLVTALALIPEVISFSIVAHVDPRVGLLSSFTFSLVIAIFGGRPGMVSAAAGSMALVAAPLVLDHGIEYLIAATVLAGVLQVALAAGGVHRLLAILPRGVTLGFVNGLAILIFAAQMRHIVSVEVLVLVVAGAALMTVARVKGVRFPPSLLSTIVLTVVAVAIGLDVPTVGDEGALPTGLPGFHVPDVAASLDVLWIVLPYAVSLAAVGLVESLLTADLIDRVTGTPSSKQREAYGQGIANVVTGFFGGQPGCAMIGQSLLCVDSGGRGRLSTFSAGGWLLVLVVLLHPVMEVMPTAALVATMVVVAVTTFDWRSITPGRVRAWPWSETAVMVLTTGVVVATSNLAIGVAVGSVLAAVLFLRQLVGSVDVVVDVGPDGASQLHDVRGALFFASTGRLIDRMQTEMGDATHVRIDFSRARVWDASAALALQEFAERARERGVQVEVTGVGESSRRLHERVREA